MTLYQWNSIPSMDVSFDGDVDVAKKTKKKRLAIKQIDLNQ